jgi:hypothetical protein
MPTTSVTFTCQPTPAAAMMLVASLASSSHAYQINDKLALKGLISGAGQCQRVSATLPSEQGPEEFDNQCRGAVPAQFTIHLVADEANEFYIKLGYAAGNALNSTSPWQLAPWAADLEDNVKNINGRNRDYLLVAAYTHTLTFSEEHSLAFVGGILDSTYFLDANRFANDEYTQFMNEALVNSGSYSLPSYDAGIGLKWQSGNWGFNLLGMNIGENDDGRNYNFWGAEGSYRWHSDKLGTGNYRLVLAGTSKDFYDVEGDSLENRAGWGISFDQALGEVVGVFLRLTRQNENSPVNYRGIYTGGLDFRGEGWGRTGDNIGIGYAYLPGGNANIDYSTVLETYYRFVVNSYLSLTADIQHMQDIRKRAPFPEQQDPRGWIISLRATAEF